MSLEILEPETETAEVNLKSIFAHIVEKLLLTKEGVAVLMMILAILLDKSMQRDKKGNIIDGGFNILVFAPLFGGLFGHTGEFRVSDALMAGSLAIWTVGGLKSLL